MTELHALSHEISVYIYIYREREREREREIDLLVIKVVKKSNCIIGVGGRGSKQLMKFLRR